MFVSARSYLISGVAMLGAGVVAVAPVQPTLGAAPAPGHFVSQAVELAAAANPITRILEVWDTSETDFAGLVNQELAAPLPSLQQVAANWIGYAADLPDISGIFGNIVANAQAAIAAPFTADPSTLDEAHQGIFAFLPDLGNLKPIVDFTTTYTSGALLGVVSPFIASGLAFMNSVQAIIGDVMASNFADAITELINVPANVVDAFLNGGQTLDLGPLLTSLGVLPISPTAGIDITDLNIEMGGVLSAGGSIFNALGLTIAIEGTDLPALPGTGAGWAGSLIGLGGVIAKALGWSGTGNPLNPNIPVPGGAAASGSAAAVAAPDADAADSVEASAPAGDKADDAGPSLAATTSAPAAPGKGLSRAPKRANSAASSDNSGSAASSDAPAKSGKAGSKRARAGHSSDNAA
jgi:hypothetical protein